MAKNYKVTIEETFSGTMAISAETEKEAEAIATQMYKQGLFQIPHDEPTIKQMSIECNAEELSTYFFEFK